MFIVKQQTGLVRLNRVLISKLRNLQPGQSCQRQPASTARKVQDATSRAESPPSTDNVADR
jgi:hypothetical protein